jgi:hypothetical protein
MAKFKRLVLKGMPFELLWEEWAEKYFKSIGDEANYEKQRKLSDERMDEVRARLKAALAARKGQGGA